MGGPGPAVTVASASLVALAALATLAQTARMSANAYTVLQRCVCILPLPIAALEAAAWVMVDTGQVPRQVVVARRELVSLFFATMALAQVQFIKAPFQRGAILAVTGAVQAIVLAAALLEMAHLVLPMIDANRIYEAFQIYFIVPRLCDLGFQCFQLHSALTRLKLKTWQTKLVFSGLNMLVFPYLIPGYAPIVWRYVSNQELFHATFIDLLCCGSEIISIQIMLLIRRLLAGKPHKAEPANAVPHHHSGNVKQPADESLNTMAVPQQATQQSKPHGSIWRTLDSSRGIEFGLFRSEMRPSIGYSASHTSNL
ncbi:hypothetical protein HK105_204552 [Polyrhizophydium stewartii]|uniref:Uncharacterized protein n=1 Tax=Polyrhizophydium stewartii TaxID=2732419 RepID=A0ABR4N8I2_9FUNG|nr:hypothetical protein HK105_004680 [Polyrhizophydium stewartii]